MIVKSLKKIAGLHPEQAAIVCENHRYTYRELWAHSTRAAKGMLLQGILPGDHIGSWSPNAVESVIVQCAALRIGATVIHLDPEASPDQVATVLERERVRSIFVRAFHLGRQYPAMIKAFRGHLTHLAHMITHGRQQRFERTVPGGWQCFLEQGQTLSAAALDERESEVAAAASRTEPIVFADGSCTVSALRLGEQEVLSAAAALDAVSGPICVDASFHRPVGLVLGCLANLVRGVTVVIPPVDADAATIIAGVRDHRCEGLIISRATAATLNQCARSHERELTGILLCLVDGSGTGELTSGLGSLFGATPEIVDHESLVVGRSMAKVEYPGVAHGILPSFGN